MTVEPGNFSNEGYTVRCCCCHAEVSKWIQHVPSGCYCINCAQRTMRMLFQDIIEYHNGKSVSLLEIMYHGNKDKEHRWLKHGVKPSGEVE